MAEEEEQKASSCVTNDVRFELLPSTDEKIKTAVCDTKLAEQWLGSVLHAVQTSGSQLRSIGIAQDGGSKLIVAPSIHEISSWTVVLQRVPPDVIAAARTWLASKRLVLAVKSESLSERQAHWQISTVELSVLAPLFEMVIQALPTLRNFDLQAVFPADIGIVSISGSLQRIIPNGSWHWERQEKTKLWVLKIKLAKYPIVVVVGPASSSSSPLLQAQAQIAIAPPPPLPAGLRFAPVSAAQLPTLTEQVQEKLAHQLDCDVIFSRVQNSNDILVDKVLASEETVLRFKQQSYSQRRLVLKPQLEQQWQIIVAAAKRMEISKQQALVYAPEFENLQKEDAQAENMLDIIQRKLATNNSLGQAAAVKAKRDKLIHMFTDVGVGIYALRGDARAGLRNRLCRMLVIFSESPTLFLRSFLNLLLLGGAGVGKTAAARVIANVYVTLGLLVEGNVHVVTAADLIGQYSGQTAPKTRAWLTRSLESVLFLDEAYGATGCQSRASGDWSTYGSEFAAELVAFLDQHTGQIAVIAAGYPDKMQNCFLAINEGLSRRFSVQLALAPYSTSDLLQILFHFVGDMTDQKLQLTPWQRQYIGQWVERMNQDVLFTNQAGDMQNLGALIAQDAIAAKVVQPDVGYSIERIDLTFAQFALTKGVVVAAEGAAAAAAASGELPAPPARRPSIGRVYSPVAREEGRPPSRKRARSRAASPRPLPPLSLSPVE